MRDRWKQKMERMQWSGKQWTVAKLRQNKQYTYLDFINRTVFCAWVFFYGVACSQLGGYIRLNYLSNCILILLKLCWFQRQGHCEKHNMRRIVAQFIMLKNTVFIHLHRQPFCRMFYMKRIPIKPRVGSTTVAQITRIKDNLIHQRTRTVEDIPLILPSSYFVFVLI